MEYNEMECKEKWAVEARNVTYTYEGSGRRALDDVSLKIAKGKKTAIMGENGSGKSTFFLCLNGIRRPDAGEILIDGKPIEYSRKGLLDVRRKVGIVFQEPDDQLFSASVYQEISFGIMNLGVDTDTARQEVERVIRELGIEPFQDRPAHALSGGQKKQVAIADILVMHPQVMILDEPAAALDVSHKRIVHEIIEKLTEQGITILMSTHDINYAYEWADEIILMHEGKVIRRGRAEEVCRDQTALGEAGLEEPSVLRMYRKLLERNLISRCTDPPRSLRELETML